MKYFKYVFPLLMTLSFSGFAQLDTSFNHSGFVMSSSGLGNAEKIVVRPDNHIIVLGLYNSYTPHTYLTGFYPDGRLDAGFVNHVLDINYGFGFNIEGIKNAGNGSLFLFGESVKNADTDSAVSDFACVRLKNNGTLDTSFGNNGVVITDLAYTDNGVWEQGNLDYTSDLVMQPDGKIILYGKTDSLGEEKLAWVRYLPDGTIDSTFGEYGIKVLTVANSLMLYPMNVATLPDGRIVSGLIQHLFSPAYWMDVVRLWPNGAPDSTYNQTGLATNPYTTYAFIATASRLQSDGKMIESGYSVLANLALMTRFDSSGNIDATFGNNGKVEVPFSKLGDMVLAPDGKIMLLGSLDTCFVLYRYLPDGQPDPDFGNGGVLKSNLMAGTSNYQAKSLVLQSDGKILLGGALATSGNSVSYVVARYLSDGKTGILEYAGQNSGRISIYPNPAQSTVRMLITEDCHNARLTIMDMSGKVLKNLNVNGQYADIDISDMASGVYQVRLQTGKHLFTKKLTVNH